MTLLFQPLLIALLLLSGMQLFGQSRINFNIPDCPVVGMEEVSRQSAIHLYPNPATDNITVEVNPETLASTQTQIELHSSSGKLVHSCTASKDEIIELHIADYPPGVYFLLFKNGAHTERKKIVKL